jgi:N-formylglutamate amidohydrolase
MTGNRHWWELVDDAGQRVPLIAHVPHAGTEIPEEERQRILLDDWELADELLISTDHHTRQLAEGARRLGGSVFGTGLSRLVVDVERFTDDDAEPQAAVGRGAVYVSTSDGARMRETDRGDRERLLDTCFRPYHAAFETAVARVLEQWGRCLIIDVHSYPSVPPPYELDQGGPRPGICVGTDPFHTPEQLAVAIEREIRAAGITVERDRPFAGTFVPLPHYRSDRRVSSVMLEIRRDLYLNEATGSPLGELGEIRRLVWRLMEVAVEAAG